ncbi:MAG: hypothetical protein LBP23_02990 [Treponema sp.]|nr:hypothetical protein [Treponema sp.]
MMTAKRTGVPAVSVLVLAAPLLLVLAFTGCQADGVDSYTVLQNLPVSLAKWQAVADAKITTEIQAAAYGNGVFVAGSRSNASAAYSHNGISWTALDAEATTFGANSFQQIRFLNGKFYAVGAGGAMASSSNGVSWTAITQSVTFGRINDVAWGAGKLVIVISGGKMAWSGNGGATWTGSDQTAIFKKDDGAAVNINSIVYGAGKFVAVGQSGTAAWSTDGITWTDAGPGVSGTHTIFGNTSAGNAGIKMIAHGNGVFVAAGQGKAAVSPDGAVWQAIDLSSLLGTGGTSWLNCVVFADGKFVAGGGNGKLVYSSDGVRWTKASQTEAIFGSNYINGIAFGDRIVNRRFVAVGGGPTIAYTVP